MGAVTTCCQQTEKVKELQNENRYLRQKLTKATASANNISQHQQTHAQRLQEYEGQISKLKTDLETASRQNNQLKKEKENSPGQEHVLEIKHLELEKTVSELSRKLDELKEKAGNREKELQNRITAMQSELASSQKEKATIQSQIGQIKDHNSKKEAELLQEVKMSEGEKETLRKQLNNKSRTFQEKLQAKDESINELKTAMARMETEKQKGPTEEEIDKQQELQEQLKKTCLQLEQLKTCQKEEMGKIQSVKYLYFFNVSLLSEENELKGFMAKSIEDRLQKRIIKTRLLYHFDELNKVNIHRYIDYKYGLAGVIKLANGQFLGVFSEGPFYPKLDSKYDAIILSLSNRRVFAPLSKHQTIAYDQQAVIFGNNDIKLKTCEKKMFSNFGNSNSAYDCQGEKVDLLLGDNNSREAVIYGYEFYEVIFQS